ncbi:MAG: hypothetical protein IPL88_02475 [Rhizobiales bacterium]|nr:hypothetical protein [Hyphomicrobiales bacterium]
MLGLIALAHPARSEGPFYPEPPAVSEAQKRKLLLPQVRSTTDCIANRVRQQSDLGAAYKEGRFRTLIGEAIASCRDQAARLVAQHDQLYGAGTGGAFLSGPYSADLERAVLSRVKPDIDRQIAAAEAKEAEERARLASIEAERQRRVGLLKDAQKLLLGAAYDCAERQIGALVRGGDGAEVLAEAAMTLCSKEVEAAIKAINATLAAESPAFQQSFAGDELVRKEMRKRVQAQAVIARARRADTPPVAAASPPPVANAPTAARDASTDETMRACLSTAHSALNSSASEKSALIRAMIEICRPEIETAARRSFFDNPKQTLDEARTAALERASSLSDGMIGVRH